MIHYTIIIKHTNISLIYSFVVEEQLKLYDNNPQTNTQHFTYRYFGNVDIYNDVEFHVPTGSC